MKKSYSVANHNFAISGELLCSAMENIAGFRHFETDCFPTDFSFTCSENLPCGYKVQYSFEYEDIQGEFGCTDEGFYLKLSPQEESPLLLWCKEGANEVYLNGNFSARLLRFALWIGFGLMTYSKDTVAIHSSCIVSDGKAVLFLGESGTGKSTHTRLWRENIQGAFLLNDDSPIVRIIDGSVWVYGSPWSGKSPCYKSERYPLEACVRLSQAPYNKMHKLPIMKGYASLHPSCPPEFAYDERIYSHISSTIGKMLGAAPVFWLECLPDAGAAELSYRTIFAK